LSNPKPKNKTRNSYIPHKISVLPPGEASDVVFLKFLRASDWDLDVAKERLKATLEWRSQNEVELLADAELPEAFQNHDHLIGTDKEGRPVLVRDRDDSNNYTA
jgi:hypothetical protein